MTFEALSLIEPLVAALTTQGYTAPTPIQAACIPLLLAGGDVCGTAQTGTGKTAAFALPILQRLTTIPGGGRVRALVLAPTRELAIQIGEAFAAYGQNLPEIRCAVLYGGMGPRAERRALSSGAEVLVATPGRLIDACGRDLVALDRVEVFVLDEADRMLDLGFVKDVTTIAKRLPTRRQTVMFSATFPKVIERLAAQILRKPARVSVAKASAVADQVRQVVHYVEKPDKRVALLRILEDPAVSRVLVFVRTKHGVDRLVANLRTARIRADSFHGDRTQDDRLRALAAFVDGTTRVLVATDVAARGIDVDGVTHVVNYDIPNVADTYVHRIGRTARAGAAGVAISLCSAEERDFLIEIERVTRQKLSVLPVPAAGAPNV